MIGQKISHYEILEKLGQGGMGVVYKAQDTKLDRLVALKFLPHHLTPSEAEQARFLQEAKAAAALNHPNVCSVIDIQESNGQQFIVMEYVDGVTLRKKAPVAKLDEAIGYAVQIGEALQAAHAKGIVHRDVKSENVMVTTDGRVKVMDFGLAKLRGSLLLTKTSSTVGTIAYMAPEMIQGGEADARSDIFSFGIVLYEMLAGRLPFRGEHEAAVMYSIVNEDPQPLESTGPSASSQLFDVIKKALEKDPARRYQAMGEVLTDLRNVKESTSLGSTELKTPTYNHSAKQHSETKRRFLVPLALVGVLAIGVLSYVLLFQQRAESNERIPVAVIDFVNDSDEKELSGLSGMLITSLEQSKRLSVLTRSRMFDILKQMGKDSVIRIDEQLGREICKRANVRAMVLASIRKFGKNYIIDLKVLDPQSDEYLLTAKEEGTGQESIPTMLDALSERTRVELKEKAAEVKTASQNIAEVTTTNLEAYQHYFQGEQLLNHLSLAEAEKEFRQAIALDSTFGLAYYRLAYTIGWTLANEHVATPYLEKAAQLIDRIPGRERYLVRMEQARYKEGFAAAFVIAREMEQRYPNDKEAMFQIGDYAYHSNDFKTAVHYLERVFAIDSTSERVLLHLADLYGRIGEGEKLLRIALRSVATRPTAASYAMLGKAYMNLGQFEAALKPMQVAQELYPADFDIASSLSRSYLALGKISEAESAFKASIVKDNLGGGIKYAKLAEVYRFAGRFKDAMWATERQIEWGFSAKDTTAIAFGHLGRAITMLFGWKDPDRALREVAKIFPIAAGIKDRLAWGYLAFVQAWSGNVEMIDKRMLATPGLGTALLSVSSSTKHDCAKAKLYADSTSHYFFPYILSPLAICQLDAGMIDEAMRTAKQLHGLMDLRGTPDHTLSYYLLGKIYEKKNEKKLAIENYEAFLDIWKNADKDLPDYVDAKTRLERLKGMAGK